MELPGYPAQQCPSVLPRREGSAPSPPSFNICRILLEYRMAKHVRADFFSRILACNCCRFVFLARVYLHGRCCSCATAAAP